MQDAESESRRVRAHTKLPVVVQLTMTNERSLVQIIIFSGGNQGKPRFLGAPHFTQRFLWQVYEPTTMSLQVADLRGWASLQDVAGSRGQGVEGSRECPALVEP